LCGGWGLRMRLVLRLVETGVEGVVRSVDVLEIDLAPPGPTKR
jgi:hypothetical protein